MAQKDIDIKAIRQNPDKYLELQLLIYGQTGIGKSTLVNSLVGETVCPVGDPGKKWNVPDDEDDGDDDAFGAETKALQKTKKEINNVSVTIWDSPGLQDGTDNEKDYLQMMYDSCKDVDLVIYCHDMTKSRWTRPDREAPRLLNETFGPDFWRKCVFVLTKANALCPDLDDGETEYDYQKLLYKNFVKKFRSQLKKAGVQGDIADNVPGVAVGRIGRKPSDRLLWYISESMGESKEQQDFLPEFWVTCFERVSGDARQKLLDISGTGRIRPVDAHSEEAQKYLQNMEERDQWLRRSLGTKCAKSVETLMVPVHSALSRYVGGKTYKSTTQVEGASALAIVPKHNSEEATPTAEGKMHGKKGIPLDVNREQLKRINDTLESDNTNKAGILYRIARWIKSLLFP